MTYIHHTYSYMHAYIEHNHKSKEYIYIYLHIDRYIIDIQLHKGGGVRSCDGWLSLRTMGGEAKRPGAASKGT